MLALFAAAAVAAAPHSPPPTERTPNFYRPPAHCGEIHDEVVRRIRTARKGRPMIAQYAVLRSIDGCGVPAPVGYRPDYLAPPKAEPQR
jgi:hypothetical protein